MNNVTLDELVFRKTVRGVSCLGGGPTTIFTTDSDETMKFHCIGVQVRAYGFDSYETDPVLKVTSPQGDLTASMDMSGVSEGFVKTFPPKSEIPPAVGAVQLAIVNAAEAGAYLVDVTAFGYYLRMAE